MVRKDEAQLGIGPLHRSQLGLSVIAERKTLVELNDAFVDAFVNDTTGGDEPDPRLVRAEVIHSEGDTR